MAEYDIDYIRAIWEGWRQPVRQLGLVDIDAAPWLAESVIDGYVDGLENSQNATAVRIYGGAMSKAERAARGLKGSAKIGAAFYDALTETGRLDPNATSRAIVSRIMRAGVWRSDEVNAASLSPEWLVQFQRGPRCCSWAKAHHGASFTGYPGVPARDCDQPFCTCRATGVPKPQEMSTGGAILGIIAFIAFVVIATIIGAAR